MRVLALLAVGFAALISGTVAAGEYQCTVYCVGPSGKTSAVVKANSASEASAIVDKTADKVCRAAGHKAATSQSMSAAQCR